MKTDFDYRTHPVVGKWRSYDAGYDNVVYEVVGFKTKLKVAGIDESDGEKFVISNVSYECSAFDKNCSRFEMSCGMRSAHKISLPLLVYFTREFPNEPQLPHSDCQEMQTAIDKAIRKSSVILTKYVLLYRLFSAMLSVANLMIRYKTRRILIAVREKIACWLSGGGPGHLENLAGA